MDFIILLQLLHMGDVHVNKGICCLLSIEECEQRWELDTLHYVLEDSEPWVQSTVVVQVNLVHSVLKVLVVWQDYLICHLHHLASRLVGVSPNDLSFD